jgi:DNA polymerase-1
MSARPIFLLFDGHAVIYRAYFGLPPLTDSKGRMVNAVYGFSRILLAAINQFEPDYLAVAFDHPKPTFRHEQFAQYKAQRPIMPDDLQPQIPLVKEIVTVLGIPQFELKGYEADDLIGTVSYWLDHQPEKLQAKQEVLTVIVTGDKDLLQLVDNNTHVWIPGRGQGQAIEYDAPKVEEKLGIKPTQVVDMKALMGDASDNIPGIKGIGAKTAVKLLQEFGDLNSLYQTVDQVSTTGGSHQLLKGNLLKKLQEGRESAYLSQQLAKITQEVPIEINLNACKIEGYDKTKAVELLTEFGFKSLIPSLPDDQFETEVQQALF